MRPWYVYVVWVVQVPAQAPEGLPPLRATALYDFVFSNDVSILLLLPAKCKTVFSGFYAAVPVSPGAAVFSILSILSAPTPDGPCRLASPINQSFELLKDLKSTLAQRGQALWRSKGPGRPAGRPGSPARAAERRGLGRHVGLADFTTAQRDGVNRAPLCS